MTQSMASKTRSSPGRSSSTLEQVSAMGGSSQAAAEFSRWSGRAPIWPRRRCAYAAADMIQFDGMQLRRDVAMSLVAQPA